MWQRKGAEDVSETMGMTKALARLRTQSNPEVPKKNRGINTDD